MSRQALRLHLSAGLLLCFALGACAQRLPVPPGTAQPSSRASSPVVRVFYKKPAESYRVLARFTERGVIGESRAQLLSALEQKAAALGADAIIVSEQTLGAPASIHYNPSGGSFALMPRQPVHIMKAVAIRLTSSRSPAAR